MIVSIDGKQRQIKSFNDGFTDVPIFPRGVEGSFKDGKWIGKTKR